MFSPAWAVGLRSSLADQAERERERERERSGDGGDEANEGDTEAGMGHATTGRLVARGGDKRANHLATALTYVTDSRNNFTRPTEDLA